MCRKFFDEGCEAGPIRGFKYMNNCEPWDAVCNTKFAFESAMRDLASEISEGGAEGGRGCGVDVVEHASTRCQE